MAESVRVQADVPYLADGSARHTLDLYLPEASQGPVPLAVYVHGGAWRVGDKAEFKHVAMGLMEAAGQQLAVAVVNYELSTRAADSVRHPAHLHSVAAALSFLVADNRCPGRGTTIDCTRVYLVGHSAGAHLLMLLALGPHPEFPHMDAIRGAIGIGGIYDIPRLLAAYPDYCDFVDMAFAPDQREPASPIHAAHTVHDAARHVRFLVVHSTGDELVNADQALAFTSQLVHAGYGNVTLAVRDLGLHDAAIGYHEFWRMVAALIDEPPST
ncbi:hypothetical protein H4R19_002431 [Coemansia spiralis]|nr:hypothetical protein H4R19_002431 [Coemansia spiralis]